MRSLIQGKELDNQFLRIIGDLLSLLVIMNLFPSSQPVSYHPLDLHSQHFDDSLSETSDSL